MLPSRPPFLESGIRRNVSDSAVETTPQSRVERPLKKMQVKAVRRSELPSYVGTETKLGRGI